MKYFNREESVVGALTALFESNGYMRYKPSSFEEYSLYQENKDFLIGKNVIVFSGLGGRLLAMRPDVTLSLIRHAECGKGATQKYYYNEKVYRQASGSAEFKEISQIGAEVVGDVDDVSETELAALACDTLSAVSEDYVLDLSHMGFTEGLLSEFGGDSAQISEFLRSKGLHDFRRLAESRNYDGKICNAFEVTVSAVGSIDDVLKQARSVVLNERMDSAVSELERLCARLQKFGYGEKINVNFSIANKADYYNGVIFNGYLQGVPHRVLSGGRYDKLLKKLGKQGGAIGYALYLGEIERYFKTEQNCVDYLVLYDKDSQELALEQAFELKKKGGSVRLSETMSEGLRYGRLVDLTKKGGKA